LFCVEDRRRKNVIRLSLFGFSLSLAFRDVDAARTLTTRTNLSGRVLMWSTAHFLWRWWQRRFLRRESNISIVVDDEIGEFSIHSVNVKGHLQVVVGTVGELWPRSILRHHFVQHVPVTLGYASNVISRTRCIGLLSIF
jgi:hypothetical protein